MRLSLYAFCPLSLRTEFTEKKEYLLLEGEVTVTPVGGDPVKFGTGDLVLFPAGMDCRWDVHKAVRKYYRFGD